MKRDGRSDCERLLDYLIRFASYPAWTDHRRLYRLHMVVHSRIQELRERGHNIVCRREGDTYLYQIRARAPKGKAA